MTPEAGLWTLALVFALAFAMLGIFGLTTHAVGVLDATIARLRGGATGLAKIFTLSGRALPLLALGLVSVVIFIATKRPVWIPLAIFASQLASQGLIELGLKHRFARARPSDWLVRLDLGYSFPSGHSTTAIVFYGAWLLVVLRAPMDRTLALSLAALLIAWMIGIDWSRIALGAHYASDVLGGTLFGCAWLATLIALAMHLRIPLSLAAP